MKQKIKMNWKKHLAFGIIMAGIITPCFMIPSVFFSWVGGYLNLITMILMILFQIGLGFTLVYFGLKLDKSASLLSEQSSESLIGIKYQ